MKKNECQYCGNLEALEKFGRLAFETETSLIIVFKDQSHKGRMIVAYKKDHVAELSDLSPEDRQAFMDDVVACADAIRKVFNPNRINYGAYGDTLGHLHFHLVPKYENGFEWGGTFQMNTGNYASDEEINEIAKLIKENFKK